MVRRVGNRLTVRVIVVGHSDRVGRVAAISSQELGRASSLVVNQNNRTSVLVFTLLACLVASLLGLKSIHVRVLLVAVNTLNRFII